MRRVFRLAGSLKTGIFFLFLLTLFSLLGVLLPQTNDPSLVGKHGGAITRTIIVSTGFNRMFSSLFYNILIALFCINILLCTISRSKRALSNIFKRRFLTIHDVARADDTTKFSCKGTVDDVVQNTIAILKKNGFSTKVAVSPDGTAIDAQKGILKQIGSVLVHLGLLPLLLGGLINGKAGFSFTQMLYPKQTIPVRSTPYHIRCDFFEVEKNGKGAIADYKSGISLLDDSGKILAQKTIEVNHPLVYHGLKVYQSSYTDDPSQIHTITLIVSGPMAGTIRKTVVINQPGDSCTVGKTTLLLKTGNFMADFVYDLKTKTAKNRSPHHHNPALHVTLLNKQDTLFSGWIFKNFGSIGLLKSAHGNNSNNHSVSFVSYATQTMTGILIKHHPGNPTIWFGIIGMSIGVLLVFWIPYRRIRSFIFISKNGSTTMYSISTYSETINGTTSLSSTTILTSAVGCERYAQDVVSDCVTKSTGVPGEAACW